MSAKSSNMNTKIPHIDSQIYTSQFSYLICEYELEKQMDSF